MYWERKRKFIYNQFLKEFKEAKVKRDFKSMSELYAEIERICNNTQSGLTITNYFTDISENNTIELPMEVKKYLLNLGQQYTYFLMKNCIDIHLDTYFREQRGILPEIILEIKPYVVEKSLCLDRLSLNTLQLRHGNVVRIELIVDGIIIEKEIDEYLYL